VSVRRSTPDPTAGSRRQRAAHHLGARAGANRSFSPSLRSDTTRKISFKPASRRSSHLRTDQDWPGRRRRTLTLDLPRSAGHMPRWHRFSAPTGFRAGQATAAPKAAAAAPRPGIPSSKRPPYVNGVSHLPGFASLPVPGLDSLRHISDPCGPQKSRRNVLNGPSNTFGNVVNGPFSTIEGSKRPIHYVRPPGTPARPARAYTAKAEHPGRIPACRPLAGHAG
jgi:hypothetical protein